MITQHGDFLQMDCPNGPTFIKWQMIVRVATGAQGDALVLFDDGKHEFVKHKPHEVIAAVQRAQASATTDGLLQHMKEPA